MISLIEIYEMVLHKFSIFSDSEDCFSFFQQISLTYHQPFPAFHISFYSIKNPIRERASIIKARLCTRSEFLSTCKLRLSS